MGDAARGEAVSAAGPARGTTGLGWLALIAAGSLGTWLGVHALRSYFAMVVWSVAEDAPATQMGAVAAGVWLVGLPGWLAARAVGGARPALRLGVLLAALAVARQALPGEVLSPVFACASAVAWLWWLPAFLRELALRGAAPLAAPAVALGVAAQVAGQAALHGIDLHMLSGPWGVLAAVALSGAFVAALSRSGGLPTSTPADGAALAGVGWGAVALHAYLFLQMTLLANLGRLQMLSGWELPSAVLLVELSLLAALAAMTLDVTRRVRLALAALALALLALAPELSGWLVLAFLPVQVGLGLLLAAAFAPAGYPARGRVYPLAAAGGVAFFVLIFLFYARDAWPPLWPVAAGLMAALALRLSSRPAPRADPRPAAAVAALALLGPGLSLLPYAAASPAPVRAQAELRVLDYNVHQGLDTWSVPAMQAIAEVIEASDADLVALQEVNRGWNISGGVDNLAWLRWRFPSYHVVYGPMHSDLFGNAIMSRYPVRDWGWQRYPPGPSKLPRGFVWATVSAQAGEVLFLSTHLTPYDREGEENRERLEQADVLLGFWAGRPRTILAGDFNNGPESEAVRRVLAGGMMDAFASLGLGQANTHRADRPFQRIDYLFTSPDVAALSAEIPSVTTSDHLPLLASFRPR